MIDNPRLINKYSTRPAKLSVEQRSADCRRFARTAAHFTMLMHYRLQIRTADCDHTGLQQQLKYAPPSIKSESQAVITKVARNKFLMLAPIACQARNELRQGRGERCGRPSGVSPMGRRTPTSQELGRKSPAP